MNYNVKLLYKIYDATKTGKHSVGEHPSRQESCSLRMHKRRNGTNDKKVEIYTNSLIQCWLDWAKKRNLIGLGDGAG